MHLLFLNFLFYITAKDKTEVLMHVPYGFTPVVYLGTYDDIYLFSLI